MNYCVLFEIPAFAGNKKARAKRMLSPFLGK